jgi:acetyltransferase-like isoleucine patch superfamily enzyme
MTVGRYAYIGDGKELFNPEVYIGSFAQIGNGYKFYGTCEHPSIKNEVTDNYPRLVANFPFGDKWEIEKYPKTFSRGKILIGCDVWLGENVTVLDGTVIGDGSIVGAGSVLSGNYPPYSVIVGNPGKVIRQRFETSVIIALLKIKWWNWTEEQVRSRIDLLMDTDKLIEAYLKGELDE